LTRPDIPERIEPLQPAWDLFRAFREFCILIGAVILNVAKSPPSPGYEPLLIKYGIDPIASRMMARLAVRSGRRSAKDGQRRSAVVSAIRFLAKPRRNRPAISRRVKVLLAAWEETSTIETIFEDAAFDEFEFISLLKSVAEGNEVAFHRLTEIAASVAPHLPNPQGPKVRAASAAHEFFLDSKVMGTELHAYTWNNSEGTCTDPVTEATRLEFNLRRFDSRPAYRRIWAKKRA
jgi:hypothetical protein